MSITKQIETCRSHLKIGNRYAYAAGISAGIRSAMSARAAKAFRKAIAEDKAEALFAALDTACPLPAKGL